MSSMQQKVNDMLATGASYAMVLRALGEDNNKLDKCDRVTIDSHPTEFIDEDDDEF